MGVAKEERIKLCNLRILPLFAACLILGIFCVKTSYVVAAVLLGVAALFILLLFWIKALKKGLVIVLIVTLLFGYGLATLELYFRNEVGLTGQVALSCRAVDVTETEDGYQVVADSIKSGGKSYSGRISFETEQAVAVGDRVYLSGEVSIKKLSLDTVYKSLEYRMGEKYTVSPDLLERKEGSPPLDHTIKEKARKTLSCYEGDRAGSFSYAMLFGDADFMEDTDKRAMREVGVAHVFAVSGLHVGVLSAALLFLLRKLRLRDKYSILVLLPLFGFYAYLVGFTPSVLRASIMVTIGLAASALGERYDDISALSLAAMRILLVRPLYLFDVSFIMSFLSILGIESLARPLEQAFLRRKIKPWLAAGLALSLATTTALLPVSAIVFGKISLAGVFLNILVVPLASIAYVLTLIALLLTVIIPPFGALLEAVGKIPLLIAELSGRVSKLGLTTNYEFSTPEVLIYYAVLLFVGKYSLATKKVKFYVGGFGVGILTLLILAV